MCLCVRTYVCICLCVCKHIVYVCVLRVETLSKVVGHFLIA